MTDYAILLHGAEKSPKAVRIAAANGNLCITGADGSQATIPWWRLFRVEDRGTTHRFRRIDAPHWELRVTSGSDRALLAHIGYRRLARALALLNRLHGLKILLGIFVLAVTFAEHLPADWTGRLLIPAAQKRLVDGVVGQYATKRCTRDDGAAALRKLLVRLDPQTGRKAEVVALDLDGFMVSSLPSNIIVVLRYALTEIDVDAFAALLAHELSHLRHGDPMAAAVRHYGHLGVWGAVFEGEDRRELRLEFSSAEERRADLEAMAMMRRAGIPLAPAAKMFEEMRKARAGGSNFAYDQRDYHFGLPARAQQWAAAARSDPKALVPVLNRDEADELFNYCWPGQIIPLPRIRRGPDDPTIPGTGKLGEAAVRD